MKNLLAPLAVIALSACVSMSNPVADGNDAKLGETADVDGQRIRPIEVLEDSRCPVDVRCVWAGQVRLKVLVLHRSGDQEIVLTSGQPESIADGMITLTAVKPEKRTDRPITSTDYRFSLEFSNGN